MRHTLWFLMVMVLFFTGLGCDTGEMSQVAGLEGESETRVYEVFGMDCPGCHGGLEKLVMKIPAVQQAKANWVEKRLTVAIEPKTELNDEDIYDAIRRANFTVGKRIK